MDDRNANLEVIRSAFARWTDGTAPITDVLAEQLHWRIAGRSAAAGDYTSRQEFVDQVLAPFGARFAHGERFRPIRIHTLLADGDTVVIVWDGRGVANDGVPYENSYAWIMRLDGGRVVDATAFFDSIALDELWSRVTP